MPRLLPIIALVLATCSQRTELPAPPDGAAETVVVIEPPGQLDVLFMIDNSPSPVGSREFGNNVALFLGELAGLPGGGPDLHAGVVTSDLGAGRLPLGNGGCARVGGDRGVLQTKPACNLPDGHRYLGVTPGSLAAAAPQLRCMMDLGVGGCGYEHQLAAVTAALDPTATPENAGFLRPGAHLAVVIVTDEDDCSAPPDTDLFHMDLPNQAAGLRCALAGHVCGGVRPPAAVFSAPLTSCQATQADGPLIPVQTLVDRVRASKPDPDRQLTLAAIFGLPAAHADADYRIIQTSVGLEYYTNCDTRMGTSAMGPRLAKFMESFGAAGSSFDVCVDDLASTVRAVGRSIVRRLTSACVPAPATDCLVTAPAPLPRCGDRIEQACWRLDTDTRCFGGARLVIEGAGTLPAGARITARCRS